MPIGERSRRVFLSRYPSGALRADDFGIEAASAPTLAAGQFLVRVLIVSVDPMLRLFADPAPLGGNLPGLPIGSTIPGAAVGQIVDSRHPDYAVGELVEGRFGWQNTAVSDGSGVNRVRQAIGAPETALGIGGLPGFTAYVGLHVAALTDGQTVLVSGAAGAVGSVVGPLAAARGIRAVGIAGGPEKVRYLTEQAGYVAAVDRHAPGFADRLKSALPDGADVYFDNVGGPMLLDIVPMLKRGGLVLVSGLMAQYQGRGPSERDNLAPVLEAVMAKGIRIQGFSQFGQDALRPAFETEIARLVASGSLDVPMRIEEGLERLPHALVGLFTDSVAGKVVVRIAQPAPLADIKEPI